jgi:hypothetical protein
MGDLWRWRPATAPVARAAAAALATAAALAGCSGETEPSLLRHDEAGPEPFLTVEGTVPDPQLGPIVADAVAAAEEAEAALRAASDDPTAGEVVEARLEAISDALGSQRVGYIRPRSAAGVPLLPGDADAVCGLDQMIELFATGGDAAAAFASVHRIGAADIADFLGSLTAGYLLDDARVINHRLNSNAARPYQTVLEAGTAVLVDRDGQVRVRCLGASPLQPALSELDGQIIETSSFADRVAGASISEEVPESVENSVDGVFTNDPDQALGPPDRVAVALGDDPDSAESHCLYYVTVEFVDNRLVDGPGDDLQVVELGRSEPTFVAIGAEPDDLRFVGETDAGSTSLDIGGVVEQGEEIAFVRICDGPDSASEVPGSDVDAVAALNSVPA